MSRKNEFISCRLVSELFFFFGFWHRERNDNRRKDGDGEFALLSLYQRRFIGLISYKHNFFFIFIG